MSGTSTGRDAGRIRTYGAATYAVAGLGLVAALAMLRPLLIDGDGLDHSSSAVYSGFLVGMRTKHPLVTPWLRVVYLACEAVGLRRYTIVALAGVSHVCAAGVFVLLARSVYPRFLAERLVSLCCAFGVVGSYGVMSRAATIEVYSLALFLDVALVAYALKADLARPGAAAVLGLLFVLATGVHVTNVLLGPFLLALILVRVPRRRVGLALASAGAAYLAGLAAMVVMLLIGQGASVWPPDLAAIRPRADLEPSLGIAGRLTRAAYGAARTVAYLPNFRDLRSGYAASYALAFSIAGVLVFFLARQGLASRPARRRHGRLFAVLAVLAIPFLVVGVGYYPSDPERWLFLMPPLWLIVGLVWDDYLPAPGVWLDRPRADALLAVLVSVLASYNALVGLLPEARSSRELAGIEQLMARVSAGDLVVSPAGIQGRIYEFFLDRRPAVENLALTALVERHKGDREALQADLNGHLATALQEGRPVFVYNLIGEGHVKQVGYPWSHFSYDYGPETFLTVLDRFEREPAVPPGPSQTGTFRLHLRATPSSN